MRKRAGRRRAYSSQSTRESAAWESFDLFGGLCRSIVEGSHLSQFRVREFSWLFQEHRDKWKGWITDGSQDGVEITYKKLADGHPLKLWRCWTDVEAPP